MSWLLDASVILAAHLRDEARHELACDFLLRAETLWMSSITPLALIDALAGAVRRERLSAADALAAERGIRALELPMVAVEAQAPAALQASLEGWGHPHDLIQVCAARAQGLCWVTLDGRQLRRLQGTPLAESAQALDRAVAGLA